MAGKSKFTPEQRERVEDGIITALDNGVSPWDRPWAVGGPRNFTTEKTYNGLLNTLILSAHSGINGWGDDWAGAGQIRKAGGALVEGAQPVHIFAPDMAKFMRENEDGTETLVTFIRGFRDVKVYNAAQTTGVTIPERGQNTDDPVEAADAMIAAVPHAAPIIHGGDVACYSPLADEIRLPLFSAFDSAADYYGVAFHEIAHSTGSGDRLNRPGVADFDTFGTDQYALEELIAEMSSAHLVALCGLDRVERSASYMASWAKRLSDDRSMILDAMEQAAEVVRWVDGTHRKLREREVAA